jgi:excisionase family DNA binding protein
VPKNKSVARLSTVNGGRPVGRRYAKITEAAEYIGVNPATIRAMLADGRLRAFKLGDRVLRVDLNEVDAAMEQGGVA